MKQKLLLILLTAGLHIAQAQFSEHHALYISSELCLGNYVGVDLNLNYLYDAKYSVKIGYATALRPPHSRPPDYSSGLLGIMLFGLANPYDQQNHYQFTLGRVYMLSERGKIRLNLSMGLAYTTIKEPRDWEFIGNYYLASNYSWRYEQWHTASIIINPKIEFPLGRCYGLTVSPMAQINKYSSYYGIGIGQMIGVLRKRTVKKNLTERK